MSPGAHYEKINMASVGASQQYETIRTMQTQVTQGLASSMLRLTLLRDRAS